MLPQTTLTPSTDSKILQSLSWDGLGMESSEHETSRDLSLGLVTAHHFLEISKELVALGFARIVGLLRFCWGLDFLRSIKRGPPVNAEFPGRGRTSALADHRPLSSRRCRRRRRFCARVLVTRLPLEPGPAAAASSSISSSIHAGIGGDGQRSTRSG